MHPVQDQQYYSIWANPKLGIQFYQVTFETASGKFRNDLPSAVFLKQIDSSLYPNPLSDYITILSGSFQDYNLSFHTILEQKVFDEKSSSTNRFGLNALATGVYIGVIAISPY